VPRFKLGVNRWSYPSSVKLEDALRHAARTGFDLFEPAVEEDDLRLLGRDEFDRRWKGLGELASSLGIGIETVATGLFWRYNPLVDSNAGVVRRIVEAEARAANILGAKVILVVPGLAVPEMGYDEQLEKLKRVWRALAPIAREYGVRIGVENVWNRLLAGPLEMKWFLEDLEPEVFGAYFDVGNVLPHSMPEHWIRLLKGRIVAVHVKDFYIPPTLDGLRFGVPLTGSINWPGVRRALEDAGYSGPITAEVPPYPGDPYKAAEDTLTALRKIFG